MENKLANLNIHKVVGLNNFSNWILTDFCSILAGTTYAIANPTLRHRLVPQSWNGADVCTIYKVSHLQTNNRKRLAHITNTCNI